MNNHEMRAFATRSGARTCCVVGLLVLAMGCGRPIFRPSPALAPARLTHGVAVGEVGTTFAVVWGRCDRATTLHVLPDGAATPLAVDVTAEHDFIGKVALENLRPGSVQRCRAWCGDSSRRSRGGHVSDRTGPRRAGARADALGRRRRRSERLPRCGPGYPSSSV